MWSWRCKALYRRATASVELHRLAAASEDVAAAEGLLTTISTAILGARMQAARQKDTASASASGAPSLMSSGAGGAVAEAAYSARDASAVAAMQSSFRKLKTRIAILRS